MSVDTPPSHPRPPAPRPDSDEALRPVTRNLRAALAALRAARSEGSDAE